MDDKFVNLEVWIQQIIKEVQDVKIQLNDTRSEMRAQFDDLRGHINRNDQTDNDNTRMVQDLRNILETSRAETNNVKGVLENRLNNLEGRLNEIRSMSNEIKNKIR